MKGGEGVIVAVVIVILAVLGVIAWFVGPCWLFQLNEAPLRCVPGVTR